MSFRLFCYQALAILIAIGIYESLNSFQSHALKRYFQEKVLVGFEVDADAYRDCDSILNYFEKREMLAEDKIELRDSLTQMEVLDTTLEVFKWAVLLLSTLFISRIFGFRLTVKNKSEG